MKTETDTANAPSSALPLASGSAFAPTGFNEWWHKAGNRFDPTGHETIYDFAYRVANHAYESGISEGWTRCNMRHLPNNGDVERRGQKTL